MSLALTTYYSQVPPIPNHRWDICKRGTSGRRLWSYMLYMYEEYVGSLERDFSWSGRLGPLSWTDLHRACEMYTHTGNLLFALARLVSPSVRDLWTRRCEYMLHHAARQEHAIGSYPETARWLIQTEFNCLVVNGLIVPENQQAAQKVWRIGAGGLSPRSITTAEDRLAMFFSCPPWPDLLRIVCAYL